MGYDIFVKDIHNVLDYLPKYFPGNKNQGYEIAGFAWWQGHKEQSTPKQVGVCQYRSGRSSGMIQDAWRESKLDAKEKEEYYPNAVNRMAVQIKGQKLHFLHAS